MSEKIFVSGMRFSRRENAPVFVIGQLGIKVDELVTFLKANVNDKGWLNIDIKKSKEGKLYCELNTYEKTAQSPKVEQAHEEVIAEPELEDDHIPF